MSPCGPLRAVGCQLYLQSIFEIDLIVVARPQHKANGDRQQREQDNGAGGFTHISSTS